MSHLNGGSSILSNHAPEPKQPQFSASMLWGRSDLKEKFYSGESSASPWVRDLLWKANIVAEKKKLGMTGLSIESMPPHMRSVHAAKMKADVIKDANEFAAKQGKVAVPISAKEKPMGSGPAQWASFEYQFRVVDKGDPSNIRTQVVHNPKIRIDKIDQDTVGIKTKAQKYDELLVLDKLRKSGIITEEEFEREKRELLNKS